MERRFDKIKKIKRLISMLLISVIVFNCMPIKTFAIQLNVNNSRLNLSGLSSDEALRFFEDLELTDVEIIDLYKADANRFNTEIRIPNRLAERMGIEYVSPEINTRSFPSNPKPGLKHTVYYDINFERAMIEAGLIGGAITSVAAVINHYSPSVVIKAIAAAIGFGASIYFIAQEIYYYIKSDKLTHKGVRGKRDYVYNLTNDLYYDWIYIQASKTETYY